MMQAVGAAPSTNNSTHLMSVSRRLSEAAWRALPPLGVTALALLAWEFVPPLLHEPTYIFPRFHQVVLALVHHSSDLLLPAARVTLTEILLGFVLGVAAGLLLGTAVGLSRLLRGGLLPILVGSQAVPVIAIAPILTILFGFGVFPKVLVAALISFFPVAMNTVGGLDSVNRSTLRLMDSFGASRWTTLRLVRFPAALPFILTGIRNAAAISVVGAVVGEWVGAASGLGPVMTASISAFEPDVTFAAILYLALIGVALFTLVALVERRVVAWHYEETARTRSGVRA